MNTNKVEPAQLNNERTNRKFFLIEVKLCLKKSDSLDTKLCNFLFTKAIKLIFVLMCR